MDATDDALLHVIAPVVAPLGAELVDVEVRKGTVVVTIERDGGLDLDALALVARAVSTALDEHEEQVPEEHYELEVTSPGLERRLRRPEHFSRVVGSRISLRTTPGTAGARRLEADLVAVDDDGILLALDGSPEQLHIAFAAIERAHTVFDWRAALAESKRAVRLEQDALLAPQGDAPARERKRPA